MTNVNALAVVSMCCGERETRVRFGACPWLIVMASLCITGIVHARAARDILAAADFKGGVIVHIGSEDVRLLTDLCAGQNSIVQGLDKSAANVAAARKAISSLGLNGRVTVRTFDGRTLPFIDNMVNLVMARDDCGVPREEISRVLAPRGVVVTVPGPPGALSRWDKPVPSELDDWTHYQHDPQNSMVGNDRIVGPPRRIQWMGGPKWLRNHDFMSSMHAMVSANGRVFYIIDEGLRNHIFLPSKWVLIARDGFNGTILWRRPLKDWHPSNWPLKSGPGHLPRRLVAVGDTVYVTAGFVQPVTAIDAITGETLRTYDRTHATEELIVSDGVVFAVTDPDSVRPAYKAEGTSYNEIKRANNGWAWSPQSAERRIVAVAADSGAVLWTRPDRVAPLTLAVTDTQVFYHNGTGMVALKRNSGTQQWASSGPTVGRVATGGSLRVSVSDGVVVFAGGVKVTAFAAKDGRQLWQGSLLRTSHHCPEDLFIIEGMIWSPNTGAAQQKGTHFKVMDLHTGKVARDFVATNLPGFPMHPRCYPSRATTRYIMTNGMGTEFYEIGGSAVDVNNVVRGSCIYGVMPCNGLLYKPPDSCACYYQSKLEYFCALAPEGEGQRSSVGDGERLEKGPAYGPVSALTPQIPASAWPMYRRDASRSGYSPAAVSAYLEKDWQVDLGGKLTQPVIADARVLVSAIEQQTLHTLDARTGKELWSFVAGGRIDSAPTLHTGRVLFGCADGWVYCLRAVDGALVWRYRAAPDDRQMLSFQQVESVWPVHGCVLVQNDTVYALAGRNMFFDGGMRLVLLNAATGEKLSETVLDEKDPATGKNLQTLINAKYMPVANRDILSSDGTRVYMREQNFDLKGKRISVAPTLPGRGGVHVSEKGGTHLFCQTGLLDDAWFHRSYWIYGDDCGEGWGAYAGTRNTAPCGRIMVLDDTRAYAFRSDPLGNMLLPRTTYDLYAADKNPTTGPVATDDGARRKDKRGGAGSVNVRWRVTAPPLLVNAMALAERTLFIAGPPDVADEGRMLGLLPGADDDLNRQLRAQSEAWDGTRGGLLRAVSADTGETLAEYKLGSFPVFDGMSVAEGRLFMSLKDGTVVSYAGK